MILYSWVFCVFTCDICLNKLTTLSLRDIPPLERLERRDDSTDTHEDLAIRGANDVHGYFVMNLFRQRFCGFEGGSLDLPNSERCDACSIAYPLYRPRF